MSKLIPRMTMNLDGESLIFNVTAACNLSGPISTLPEKADLFSFGFGNMIKRRFNIK